VRPQLDEVPLRCEQEPRLGVLTGKNPESGEVLAYRGRPYHVFGSSVLALKTTVAARCHGFVNFNRFSHGREFRTPSTHLASFSLLIFETKLDKNYQFCLQPHGYRGGFSPRAKAARP
jgi:hypothetical protein